MSSHIVDIISYIVDIILVMVVIFLAILTKSIVKNLKRKTEYISYNKAMKIINEKIKWKELEK